MCYIDAQTMWCLPDPIALRVSQICIVLLKAARRRAQRSCTLLFDCAYRHGHLRLCPRDIASKAHALSMWLAYHRHMLRTNPAPNYLQFFQQTLVHSLASTCIDWYYGGGALIPNRQRA